MTVADILPKGEKPSMPMENGEITYRGVATIQDKGSKWRIKVNDAIAKALGKRKLDDNRPCGGASGPVRMPLRQLWRKSTRCWGGAEGASGKKRLAGRRS